MLNNQKSQKAYDRGLGLRQQGQNSSTRVASNDRHGILCSIFRLANHRGDEGGSPNNVQVAHTKEPIGVRY